MNKRTCSIVLALGLVVSGVLAGPATAAKKKKKPKPAPAVCATYTPGELGADKPTVVVNDTHTADAPLIQKVTLDRSVADADLVGTGQVHASYDYFNVQVDSAAASAGLYVTIEFPTHRDYDLWAYFADGTGAASSHGFQPLIELAGQQVPVWGAEPANTLSNHGGESTATSENLVGIITPDCGGYTIETANWLGEGGEFEVKVWLGEGKIEPGVPE